MSAYRSSDRITNSDIGETWKMPWEKLHNAGIGIYPDQKYNGNDNLLLHKEYNTESDVKVSDIQQKLHDYGYNIKITGEWDAQTTYTVDAFRRHFNPETTIEGNTDSWYESDQFILNKLWDIVGIE